jgi:DNA replication protein DnaC
LIEAKDERRLMRFQKMLSSFELLIIDELGFVPLSKTGPNCCSRSSAGATNAAPRWSPAT